jgi:hypothetical protein
MLTEPFEEPYGFDGTPAANADEAQIKSATDKRKNLFIKYNTSQILNKSIVFQDK